MLELRIKNFDDTICNLCCDLFALLYLLTIVSLVAYDLCVFSLFYQEFNAGLFDYLIATDDSQTKEKEQANKDKDVDSRKSRKGAKPKIDSEFGVVRGIDFKNVYTVSPPFASGYFTL